MKVLFITDSEADYASDSLLIGLRRLLGENVVDFPRKDILYAGCVTSALSRIRGHGFTLYGGPLEPIDLDRSSIPGRIADGEFDLVVIGDIWRSFGFFWQHHSILKGRVAFVDGQDTELIYPAAGRWYRDFTFLTAPGTRAYGPYFKREIGPSSRWSLASRLVSRRVLTWLDPNPHLLPISFGVPSEKIREYPLQKKRDFPSHIVDDEVATHLGLVSRGYTFSNESDYYDDLASARFGITTKRAGWDCLRHYEIAANGSVPCFRGLDEKPVLSAPHGLVSGVNCIAYSSYLDLREKIDRLDSSGYDKLVVAGLEWVRHHECSAVANRFLRVACKALGIRYFPARSLIAVGRA